MNAIALPEKAQQILDGTMGEKLRGGIAAGAVPMPPVDLVSCLAVIAARDADEELRTKATKTLQDLPPPVRKTAMQSPLAPPVFRVLIKFWELSREEREWLALNNDVPDDVLADVARVESDAGVLDILAGNQTRMLRYVGFVEALLGNPSIGPATRAKLEEFFGRAYAGKILLQQGLATKEDLAADEEWDQDLLDAVAAAPNEASGADDRLLNELIQADDHEVADEEEAAQLIATASGDVEAGKEESVNMANLRKAIKDMAVPAKIKLALMGGKEARSLLIIDGNKVISSMVIRNPRITLKEVQAIAASKTVRDDMLRSIARDKKFMKVYAIKLALVANPKTPVAIALQMLPQMRDADLKKLAKSKSVSNNIATQARRMVQKKAQK